MVKNFHCTEDLAEFFSTSHQCKSSADYCSVLAKAASLCALRTSETSSGTHHIATTAERPSHNGRLDELSLQSFNYQVRQVVRGDGYVASVTNQRRLPLRDRMQHRFCNNDGTDRAGNLLAGGRKSYSCPICRCPGRQVSPCAEISGYANLEARWRTWDCLVFYGTALPGKRFMKPASTPESPN